MESLSTAVRGLKSIAKARKIAGCAPHALMQYDMDCRAHVALALLMLKRTHARLEYLFTGDEKWILSSNVHRMPYGLTKVRMQKTFLNPTYTPKRLCFVSGGAYTASNTRQLRDLQ
ncbi:hypothetical protein ANCCEY_11172 [Ancylostoma ceylanicum]|uniref:Uncharacterized protein n=2 Tax=Ancylostoma ceylanicum TaxID=53326 RepID=A0A0D6LEV8_9BILA|nr:hypothetical protein ANCCEY_11172 [Ancylostoma ceylanicum]EYC10224.1 hypothetical protein Y032_0057g2828 [Ancylostoma ceylanicum]